MCYLPNVCFVLFFKKKGVKTKTIWLSGLNAKLTGCLLEVHLHELGINLLDSLSGKRLKIPF